VTLALCGLTAEASLLLEPLEQMQPQNLALQFDLALLYDMGNNPALAYRVGRKLSWRIPEERRSNLPLPLYSVLFPFPYRNETVQWGTHYKVDPILVCSVIRQESIFDPAIMSPAGAIGLMQIMPFTGKAIAKSFGEDFPQDSLYRPHWSIRYGTYYLHQLLDQFQGDLIQAIAGYNGGPNNARRWHATNSRLGYDLYVESIGFTETREYVKRVMANYWTYRLVGPFLGYPGT
jgi:soluble lytic murein transglycosylase